MHFSLHNQLILLIECLTVLCALRSFGQETVTAQLLDIIPAPERSYSYYYFSCETNGFCAAGSLPELSALSPGDRVRVSTTPIDLHRQKIISVDLIKHDLLTIPHTYSAQDVLQRHHILSSVEGVVQSACTDETNPTWNWLTLRSAGGDLAVAAKTYDYPLEYLRSLIDAEVRFSGYTKLLNTWRSGLGSCFVLIRALPPQVINPATTNAHDIPEWNGSHSPHRQRVQGRVIACGQKRIFIRSNDGTFAEIHPQASPNEVRLGDVIIAAGFTNPLADGILMSEALIEATGHRQDVHESVDNISFEQLYSESSDRESFNHRYLHRIIRLSGVLLSIQSNSLDNDTLLLGNGHHTVSIEPHSSVDNLTDAIPIGSHIEVTGLCLADVDRDPRLPANIHFRSFYILPRTTSDIRILSRSTWWTTTRLLIIIGILLTSIIGILIWNHSLRILSEHRGRALFKEQIAHVSTELRTSERTRLAVELHDSLSQNLAGVSFQITAAKRKYDSDPIAAATHLNTAEKMLRSSRMEFRRCLWDLREETLDAPVFSDAVAKSVNPVSGDATISINLDLPRQRLTDTTAHALLRMIRELVSNATTHGKATRIDITGELRGLVLSFSVADNGIGFDPECYPGVDCGHFGLAGIGERIKRLRGKITIESSPDTGTRVTVTIPTNILNPTIERLS